MVDNHGHGALHALTGSSSWRSRLSYRNATVLLCFFNVVTIILLLQCMFAPSNKKFTKNRYESVQLRYIRESEAIRRAMVPLELIKRVKEIQQEPYIQPETVVQRKAPKQNSASDLSKRLKDLQALNDANSKKGTMTFCCYIPSFCDQERMRSSGIH
ncbi:hypothetical protein AMTRI_Chr07g76410 [Amborella trichopoda]